VHSSAV